MITPITASVLTDFFEKYPSRNNPSIPPLKIDASDHHASRALFTPTSARAIKIPIVPVRKDER